MPRGLMDNLECEVIGEEIYEGGLENRLGSRPRGFESHSLRHIEPKIDDFGLFFFHFCLIFDIHSPLSRKTPFSAFRLSISFLQGCARQLQGCSKTPCFLGRIDTGRYANKLSRYHLICTHAREFEFATII